MLYAGFITVGNVCLRCYILLAALFDFVVLLVMATDDPTQSLSISWGAGTQGETLHYHERSTL